MSRGHLLITGGAGFIGHHAVREALARGYGVTVVDDLSTGRPGRLPLAARLVELDIRDPALGDLLAAERFDGVLHLAAQTSVRYSMEQPAEDRAINLVATEALLAGLARVNPAARIVFVSTAAVYGEQGGTVTEASATAPRSAYGAHKLAAEDRVRRFGLSHAVLRLANVYGPGQRSDADGGVVAIFLDRLARGLPLTIHGDGGQTRDFIHVDDVARALVDALGWDQDGVWNVSTGVETSLNAVLSSIAGLLGRAPAVEHGPPRPGDLRHSCLGNARILGTTTWRPLIAPEDGLARTLAAEGILTYS